MDTLTPSQRHKVMAAIRSKDTKPEMLVRRYLWGKGFRYRLNHKRLPGHPDLVLLKYRTCIFVNGCFWHGHGARLVDGVLTGDAEVCGAFHLPKTNRGYWQPKILRNQERDERELHQLARMGWHCIVVWECELRPAVRQRTLDGLALTLNHIFLQDRRGSYLRGQDEGDEPMRAAEEEVPWK